MWEDVNGFGGKYQANVDGRVRIKSSKRVLKATKDKISGYYRFGLYVDGKTITRATHRIIAETFIPNPENKKHVHHIDDDKSNNSACNLMWVSPKEHGALRSEESKERGKATYKKNKVIRKKIKR